MLSGTEQLWVCPDCQHVGFNNKNISIWLYISPHNNRIVHCRTFKITLVDKVKLRVKVVYKVKLKVTVVFKVKLWVKEVCKAKFRI